MRCSYAVPWLFVVLVACLIASFQIVKDVQVMIATNKKGEECFEAESPDEGALVEGAQQLGWQLGCSFPEQNSCDFRDVLLVFCCANEVVRHKCKKAFGSWQVKQFWMILILRSLAEAFLQAHGRVHRGEREWSFGRVSNSGCQ